MTGTDARPQVDPALVRAAQRGDPIALGDLMDLLAPYVGRICGPIALQDGPDAAQETLIVVLRNIGQLRDHAALFGWVRAIAVREAVRVAVRAKRSSGDRLEEFMRRRGPAARHRRRRRAGAADRRAPGGARAA